MSTSWPSVVASDLISGKGAACTVPQALFNRDLCLINKHTTWLQTTATFAASAWGTYVGTRYVHIPTYMVGAWVGGSYGTISLALLFRVTSGSGTIHFRLAELGTPATGTDQTTSSGTSVALTSVLTIPASGWWNNNKQFAAECYITGGATGEITGYAMAGNFWFRD